MPAHNPTPAEAPLSMTVHAMPLPGAHLVHAQERRTRWGRVQMVLLLLVCLAPVVASYITFYWIKPSGGPRSQSTLIAPVRDLPTALATDLQGRTVALSTLKGQWLLMVVAGGDCDALCQNQLYFQRQLREVLGKEKDRVDRVWLITDDAPVPDSVRPALAQATVLRVSPQVLAGWLQADSGRPLKDHLYVADPMGNAMMRTAPELTVEKAAGVKRDLERLLRASKSWDAAGR